MLFVIGIKNLKNRQKYLNEADKFNDILIIENLEENYHRMTFKVFF